MSYSSIKTARSNLPIWVGVKEIWPVKESIVIPGTGSSIVYPVLYGMLSPGFCRGLTNLNFNESPSPSVVFKLNVAGWLTQKVGTGRASTLGDELFYELANILDST